jgi:hypothetical protein
MATYREDMQALTDALNERVRRGDTATRGAVVTELMADLGVDRMECWDDIEHIQQRAERKGLGPIGVGDVMMGYVAGLLAGARREREARDGA